MLATARPSCISGNKAHTDNSKMKQEDRKFLGLKTLKHRKQNAQSSLTRPFLMSSFSFFVFSYFYRFLVYMADLVGH